MACNTFSDSGKGLVIWLDEDCYHRLAPPAETVNPSIPVQIENQQVELRDGSAANPIVLPAIQGHSTNSIAALLVQTESGTIKSWRASGLTGRKKLVLFEGLFSLEEDLNTDLFKDTMCSARCKDIHGLIGYREIMVQCTGQADIPAIQLFKVPVCSIEEVPDPDA